MGPPHGSKGATNEPWLDRQVGLNKERRLQGWVSTVRFQTLPAAVPDPGRLVPFKGF